MTKIEDGGYVFNRKLRVHLSRLKALTIHVNIGKTLPKEGSRKEGSWKEGSWEHSPIVKVHKISLLSYNEDNTDKIPLCISPSPKRFPGPFQNSKYTPLGSELAHNENGPCFSDSGISLDDYSDEARFGQSSVRLGQAYRREQSESETDDHCIRGHIWDGHMRSDRMTEIREQSVDYFTSQEIHSVDDQLNMRNKHRQKRMVSYIQKSNILGKRKQQNRGRNVLRPKQLFSSSRDNKNIDYGNQGGKLGKRKLVITLKPVKPKQTREKLASLLLNIEQTKKLKKLTREDFKECDSLKTIAASKECPGLKESQSVETCVISENTESIDDTRGTNHNKVNGTFGKLKRGDSRGGGDNVSNKKRRLQYSDVNSKKASTDQAIEGDSGKTLKDGNRPSLPEECSVTMDQNKSLGVGSEMTSTEKEKTELPLYHNQIQTLKAELKQIHRTQLREKADSRRKSGFDSTDCGRPKLSLTLRCSTPSSSPSVDRVETRETVKVDTPRSLANWKTDTRGELADNDDDDDVVIIESITTLKALNRAQITSCMSDFLDTGKTLSEIPTLEEVYQKLKSIFGQKIIPWKSYVKKQYRLINTTGSSAPPSPVTILEDKVLVTVGRYTISHADLSSLDRDAWVNDNIINAYFQLITEMSPLKVFPSSTFFYQVYCRNGFTHVQRWHRKIDIFSHQVILIPVHSRHHWCLVVVNIDNSTITFYDSMRQNGKAYLTKVERYMKEEAAARAIKPADWTLKSSEGIPQQRNYSDCGVFVCQYAKRLGFNKHVIFSHLEAAEFRQVMKSELLSKHLEQ